MAKLQWDVAAQHVYENGVSNVALYTKDAKSTHASGYGNGVAWNGVTGITESPSGADITKIYANNGVYAQLQAAEEFGCTIEAYTYPDEFAACDGSASPIKGVKFGQQARKPFGLAYKTLVGDAANGSEANYKVHIMYGGLASPSERAYATVNDNPEAITFSWEVSTTPVSVEGLKDVEGNELKATSIITIDSKDFADEERKAKLKALEDILFGSESEEAYLPTPKEVYTLLGGTAE